MAESSSPALAYDTAFDPQTGTAVSVSAGLQRITAPNGGPYTFTGTNSFIVGHDSVALIDPGPSDAGHREALLAAIGGRKLEAVILTHTHKDHSASAAAWRKSTGAPLWFAGPHRLSRPPRLLEINALARECDWGLSPDRIFFDGESFEVGGVGLTAVGTPGHCANHLCFGITGTGSMLSGDHVMGWNSTLVAVPDGSMADYLASLRKVIELPYSRYVPSHGAEIVDGPGYARALLAHRELRNRQIIEAVSGGAQSVGALLERIYPTLKPALRIAAGLTLRAHIEYLEASGAIGVKRGPFRFRLLPA